MIVLLLIKIMLFISITNIEHNTMTIFLFTSLLSLVIICGMELLDAKYRKPIKIVFYTSISLIMFVDVMHYAYFKELPSVELLGQVAALATVGDSIVKLLSLKNLLFIIDLPLFIYFILKRDKKVKLSKKTTKWISALSIIAIVFIGTTIVNADKASLLTNQEFYAYHTHDIVKKYFKDEIDDGQDAKDALEIMKNKKKRADPDAKHFGIAKDRNLIVVQIESLQDFVIDLDYHGQEVTPNLNNFIKDKSSLYFDEYYQLIGRGNTSDAEFITNNSLHPSSEEPTYLQYADNKFYGLPWLLRDNGYNAWVFHGFEKEFWNRRQAYPNQGFQRFLSEEDFEYEEKIVFGISDREFYQQTLAYLKELDSIDENPFYSLIITLSSHTPYTMDEKYHVLEILGAQKNTIVGDYLQAIHYADKEFGKFIEGLKAEGLYEDSVIAVYGDHYGISNGDEQVFDPMEDILGEPYNFDHIMNIPLIINVPGQEINETISKLGSQIDFYPTIINILGLENEKGYMMGIDLINSDQYNYVAPQRVMRRGSFIDEDVILDLSADGIFANSRVKDRKTRKELNAEEYRDTYNDIIEYLDISDQILANDLFKYLLDEDEDIEDLIAEKNKNIKFPKTIKTLKDFSMEDLDKKYKSLYSRREKIIRLYIDEETDIEGLEKWMDENQDAKLILHSRQENTKQLEEIKKKYKQLKNRSIAEIDDFNDYFKVQLRGFKDIILDIRDREYEESEILDFLKLNNHFGIITEKNTLTKEFETKVKEKGIKIYIEKFNRLIEK